MLLHRIGQLTAGVVTHIAGRRSEQSLIGVLVPVFAHIKANQRALIPEDIPGHRLCHLRFSGSCRPGKKENALRSSRGMLKSRQPRRRTLDHVRHCIDRRGLSFDILPQRFRDPDQLFLAEPAPGIVLLSIAISVNGLGRFTERELSLAAKSQDPVQLHVGKSFCNTYQAVFHFIKLIGTELLNIPEFEPMRADQFQAHLPFRLVDRYHLHERIVQIDPGRKIVGFLKSKMVVKFDDKGLERYNNLYKDRIRTWELKARIAMNASR